MARTGRLTWADVEADDPSAAIRAALLSDPDVRSVELTGSRANGTPTELSDWDYHVRFTDPVATAGRLPGLVAELKPLAALWDPLADRAVYMIVLPGAVKADLFPGLPSGHGSESPPEVGAATLPAIDAHFWDWNLWLGGKRLRGQDRLVAAELAKMWSYLLGPLGADRPPADQDEAIATYLDLRSRHEERFGLTVARDLGDAVSARLAVTGLSSG